MYLLISYSLGHILRPLVSAKPEFSGDNFLRGCKWWAYGPWYVEWDQPGFRVIQVSCCILSPQFTNRAPDGTCVLVCSNDNKLRLYNLPVELYSGVVKGLPDMVCRVLLRYHSVCTVLSCYIGSLIVVFDYIWLGFSLDCCRRWWSLWLLLVSTNGIRRSYHLLVSSCQCIDKLYRV